MSEINDYTQYIPELAIIGQTFHILAIIFYSYGIKKWIDFGTHFMIQQRFPMISKLIVLICFVGSTLSMIRRWTQFHHSDALYSPQSKDSIEYILWKTIIQSSGQSLSFFVYGLVNERLLLIYLRWKHNRTSIQSIHNAPIAHMYKNIYYNPFCLAIFVFTIIGFLFMLLYRLFDDINSKMIIINTLFWMMAFIITVILIFIIICKKVKDGIGCLTETIILLSYLLLASTLPPLAYTKDSLIFPCYAMLSTTPFVQGFLPLYIPLYFIYKLEGTLNIKSQKQKTKQRIAYHIKNTEYPLNNVTIVTQENNGKVSVDPQTPTVNSGTLCFFQYIKEYKNYKCFCKYLQYLWAAENILFLERVSIIYQIIIKYKKQNGIDDKKIQKYSENMNSYQQTVEIQENFLMKPLKFEYLKQIYSEYETIINENITDSNQCDLECLQKPFRIIYQNIYNEFIAELSRNQINISSPTKIHLTSILEDNIDKLTTFDDFLCLFNDAKEEIGGLLISMYDYRFKEFVKNGANKNNIMDE